MGFYLIVLVYGLLVLAGGIMGYVKAKSLPSIIMGIIFGVFIIWSSTIMYKGDPLGTYLSLAASLILAAFFAMRFRVTKKFMPAGLMIILSVISVITLLIRLRY